jgi:hypothetical protein
MYIFKVDVIFLKFILLIVFFISSYGVFSNTLKLNDLHILLKGFRND